MVNGVCKEESNLFPDYGASVDWFGNDVDLSLDSHYRVPTLIIIWVWTVGMYMFLLDRTMEHGRRYIYAPPKTERMVIGLEFWWPYPVALLESGLFMTRSG